jgi:transcriptional regulator GlxA family with amidase domain
MRNLNISFKLPWSETKIPSSRNYNSTKIRTYPTHPSIKETKTTNAIRQSQRMEDNTINNKRTQQWLEELEQQVIANISKMNFTAAHLASFMNISHRQLYRLMNERLGETPHTYLKNYRLNYAKKLIETKQVDSVKAAAYSTGFPNPAYFSKQFKTTFGYLPSELL